MNEDERTGEAWLAERIEFGDPRAAMLRLAAKSPAHRRAGDRVRAWTRLRFKLPEDATVLVAEIACALPGCPPLETVVVFWSDAATRHRFKVFKPVEQVVEDDLPYAWLKEALIDDGSSWECC